MGIMERMRLDGKAILVTGGARGIGKSVSTAFCEAGADVAIADIDLEEAQKTANDIAKATGRRTIAIRADVTNPADAAAMVDAVILAFGKLDVVMCNAGICKNIPAAEMTLDDWKQVIDINLTGVFLTAQAAGRQMIKQGRGGSIINTASMSGHIVNFPQPQCSYNASKAGVIQLTKSLAIEWADQNIRVNSLSPGYIGTELTLASKTLKPLITQWNAIAPLHRLGGPEELQAICVYLAGDAASFTTGADFVIDGAFTCI